MAANLSVAAGNDGVCSASEAIRTSVAGTQFYPTGTYTRSAVTSTTQDLRLAYPGVECNIPVVA